MEGVEQARDAGLIVPILIGPRARIEAAARASGTSLDGIELIDTPHSHASAAQGVRLAAQRRVDAVMKGSLHTDELLEAVVARDGGLRTGRRISHVYAMDVPAYDRLLLATDAAVNVAPDLAAKRDIAQNAIDLARVLGIEEPKVAVLSAVETVNPKMPSTLDAAALAVMARRGQIRGGIVDGPLAFDNAIDREAARTKGLDSPVAGQADILLVPDIEAGNMVAKQLLYFAGADGAGLVLGAKVPVVLTSRADGVRVRAWPRWRWPACCARAACEGGRLMHLLAVNAGSSNTKLALFEIDDGAPTRIGKAQAIRDGDHWRLAFDGEDAPPQPAGDDPQAALLAAVDAHWPLAGIDAIGHRVVHGGTRFQAPLRVDAEAMAALRALEPLAPLHQPANLAMIDAVAARLPAMPQVACFDTGFHATLPEHAWRFAIPHALADAGIRRYGFHGLSYQSIRDRLRARAPGLARGRVVVAHLGAGCSACAMRDGVSLDTSMGFSALDGLPMATRSGALDPGVLLHLMQQHGMSADAVHDMLYRDCGLRGMSASAATCASWSTTTTRARRWRWRCSPSAWPARSAHWPSRWAASTAWCSPPAWANTSRASAR